MHYTKHFNINGVDTKQVACIELQGKPNAATEGALGVLGIDVTSPTHDVYKCVAVNGSIYTWEFLSSGMSIIAATKTGEGFRNKTFGYSDLLYPEGYVVRRGDLILDSGGYLYRVTALGNTSCDATYTGTQFGVSRDILGVATAVRTINDVELGFFVGTLEEYGALTDVEKQNLFAIITDDTSKEEFEKALAELSKNHETLKGSLTDGSLVVAKATSATSATSATKATNDGNGNNIASTYAKTSDLTDGSLEVVKAKEAGMSNAVKCHNLVGVLFDGSTAEYSIGNIPAPSLLIFEFYNTAVGDATAFAVYAGAEKTNGRYMRVEFEYDSLAFRFWVNGGKLYISPRELPGSGSSYLDNFWYIPLDV